MKTLRILLVEDDKIEVMKFKRAMLKHSDDHQLFSAGNGSDALADLHSSNVLPEVIFLDLNMPKMNGLEFLEILKSDPELRFIPTVMLTTSANPKDLKRAFDIGVSGYLIKPLTYLEYQDRIIKALSYWCENELVRSSLKQPK
jgi:PleD family two-component response regulator